MKKVTTACICLIALLPGGVQSATVTINTQKTYQTMEGFGAFTQSRSKYTDTTYTNFLHNDAGFTVVRLPVPCELELQNENSDQNVMDLAKFSLTGMNEQINIVNGMKRFGDVRIIASLWSPPKWMKDMSRDAYGPGGYNDPEYCGGHLRADMREELAEFLSAFCKIIKQKTGVDIYAISLQNESFFTEPYYSCVYTYDEYKEALKVVAARFARDTIPTKLFGPEDMADQVTNRPYAAAINGDATAKAALSAYAVHGYINGITPTDNTNGIGIWKRVGDVGHTMLDKKVWMTETSGFAMTWDGALRLASVMYQALRYGWISTWVFWADCEGNGQETTYALLSAWRHTKRSLVSKNYYKFIRPGAVRVDCTTPDSNSLYVNAFTHATENSMTLVLVNWGAATSVTLGGANLPANFTKYTTSATKNCVDEGVVGAATAISIDGSSVTTLYSKGITGTIAPAASKAGFVRATHADPAEYFSLTGKRIVHPDRGLHERHLGIMIRRGDARTVVTTIR